MMKKYIIQGRFWSAGDDIYIESKNDQGKWNEINLNSFIKENIEQESNICITIDVKDKNITNASCFYTEKEKLK